MWASEQPYQVGRKHNGRLVRGHVVTRQVASVEQRHGESTTSLEASDCNPDSKPKFLSSVELRSELACSWELYCPRTSRRNSWTFRKRLFSNGVKKVG